LCGLAPDDIGLLDFCDDVPALREMIRPFVEFASPKTGDSSPQT
jgi:hypothetical protein